MKIQLVRRSDATVPVVIPGHANIEGTVPAEFVADVVGAGMVNLERVRLRVSCSDGESKCTGIYLVANAGEAVTQADLKRVSLRKLVDAAVASVADATLWVQDDEEGDPLGMPVGAGSFYVSGDDGGRIEAHQLVQDALRPRRRSVTPEFLASVAEVYLADNTGAPTVAVQKHFFGSHRSATRWVSLARDAGLIPPVQRKNPTKETGK